MTTNSQSKQPDNRKYWVYPVGFLAGAIATNLGVYGILVVFLFAIPLYYLLKEQL